MDILERYIVQNLEDASYEYDIIKVSQQELGIILDLIKKQEKQIEQLLLENSALLEELETKERKQI